MKTINKNIAKQSFLLSLSVLSLLACTKELPYQEVYKGNELNSKTLVSEQSDYLMSSSMLEASRSSQDALPFSAGDNKRVRMKWEEKALVIYEMDSDSRFQENSTNNKPVMVIPVTYKDFECAKDKYGDCTNTEAEKSNVDWKAKTQFVVDKESAKSMRLEVLPLLVDMKLDDRPCYSETASVVEAFKLDDKSLNITIRRTFDVAPRCAGLSLLSDTTVSALYSYSLVKTDSILSPGFKTVMYPKVDERTFGFFSTQRQELDVDNNATTRGEVSIMNHWDPRRQVIDYYLTDNFYKPENSKILEQTQKVFESLNTGLKLSGAQFQLRLNAGKGKNPGDIRNSMIILVEDPVASSVIGYGPQVEDPTTGEIVSARTVMFLGTIKTFIQSTYDDILREKAKTKVAVTQKPPASVDDPETDPNGGLVIENALQVKMLGSKYLGSVSSSIARVPSLLKTMAAAKVEQDKKTTGSPQLDPVRMAMVARIQSELRNLTKRQKDIDKTDPLAHFKYLRDAKNCARELDVDTLSAISPKLMKLIPDDARPWNELSEARKQEIIDIILPEVWVPTLIHEVGHNLGLRHNFGGSEDPANFYSAAELKQMGIENMIPSSTVMEYIEDLRALPVLGKYDIAALRFAYAGRVELLDGTSIAVSGTIADTISAAVANKQSLSLKDYRYCTDEHTGINPGCRRFDLGTNYTAITLNAIESYENRYEYANRRGGRANFSLWDDPGYLGRTQARFESMRLMQEVYARIKADNRLTDSDPLWEEDAGLKDLKLAATLTGQFLINVLATPDLTCLFENSNNPGKIADIQRLDNVRSDLVDCFDLNPLFEKGNSPWKVVGQYGKSFRSKKDPKSDNPYADQIDVRGVWMDKLAAARVLFKRSLGVSSLDENTDNFMDREDLFQDIVNLSIGSLFNQASAEQVVTWEDGSRESIPVPVDSQLTIEKPIHPFLAMAMGLKNDSVPFNSVLLQTMDKYMVDNAHLIAGNQILEAFRIQPTAEAQNWPVSMKTVRVAGQSFVAGPENIVAINAIDQLNVSKVLAALPPAKLAEILKLKKDGKTAPSDAKSEEKAVWALDAEKIQSFLTGEIQMPGFYQELIMNLLRR